MTIEKANKGSATLLVMLLSAVIITLGIGFDWIVKEHMKATYDLELKTQGMLRAYSIMDKLLYMISVSTFTPKAINSDVVLKPFKSSLLPLDGTYIKFKDLEVSIQDANGLLSVSYPNVDALKNLLAQNTSANPNVVLKAWLDWINPSYRDEDIPSDFYKDYLPRKYLPQYKEEFSLVYGMTKKDYNAIKDYITLMPNSGFNPNTAPVPVLMARLNITKDQANLIKEYLKSHALTSDQQLESLVSRKISLPNMRVYYFPADTMRILVLALHKGRPIYKIHADILKKPNLSFPFTILYWKEY
ncbi:MAG: general secretion pathway protein GspK [Hydrogenobaculum sp.]|nr:MAG: general secretion pathway protein GspK [Hydrogenobaculum sp.]